MSAILRVFIVFTLALLLASPLNAETLNADSLTQYKPAKLSKQTITSVGSDSMGGLMQRWITAYSKKQPEVRVQVSSRGSASAPPALIEGSADLGPMARQMKRAERLQFLSAYGFQPTEIQVAYAAVAIYVAKNSPRKTISISELQELYSESNTQTKSQPQSTVLYGQIGHPYLAGYFKQKVLLQKPFSKSISETASPSALYEALGSNDKAIGFAAYDSKYPSDKVRLLAVVSETGAKAVAPSMASIADGSYVLSRSLNIYTARQPGEPMEAPLKDFLTFVLSQQGQQIVAQQGLIPLSNPQILTQRVKLN